MKEYTEKEDGIVYHEQSDEFYFRHPGSTPEGIWCRIDRRALVGKLMREGRTLDEVKEIINRVEQHCTVQQVKEQCFDKQGIHDYGQTLVLLPAIYRN